MLAGRLPELLIIAFIIVLLFGVGRLPEVGSAVGRGIKEFRKATKDDEDHADASSTAAGSAAAPSASAPAASGTIFCGECGSRNPRGAKFCAECGKQLNAPAG